MSWLLAFLITQVVEMPIYQRAFAPERSQTHRLAIAFGASAITHPIVWFVFREGIEDYLTYLLIAETFAWVAEGLWFRLWRIDHPFAWSLCANAASVAAGGLIQLVLVWN